MIPIVFNSVDAFLLDDRIEWSTGFKLEASLPTSFERGLTGRETRRATADTLRLACKFTVLLTSSEVITNLRNSLQALGDENVLCPFWPAEFAAGDAPPVTAAFYALFDDDGNFDSIQPHSALPFLLSAFPLMVGILTNNPDPQLNTDSVTTVEFEFSDNGNYPLTPAAFAPPAGLTATGGAGARPLFPWTPNWTTLPTSGDSERDIDRRQIGNLRTLATAYYAQRGRRRTTQFFTLQNSDAFDLLRFFQDMGGEQNNFWLGACMSEASLAVNLGSADTALTVDNGAALGTNSLILISDGVNRKPLVVDSVAGDVWTLHAAAGVAFAAGRSRIESLVLARFDALKLTIDFTSPAFATAKIGFKELPWETNAVAGETYGTTMGALPLTGNFFKFTMTTPSGATIWRFTGFERDLSDGANDWLSAPMEFDSITDTADLKRNTTTITSRNFNGNPLALLFPLALEWPLMIQIYEGDVDGAANAVSNLRCYFSGEVGGADLEPPFIKAQCATLSHIFDRQIPRRLYQQTDNWCLFEPANGLLPADWQWNAVVVSYNAATSTLVVNTVTSSNGAALVNHYFAGGYLIITAAAGGAQQVRMIGDATAPAGGAIMIYLSLPLTTAPTAGDVVNLFPGYDGQASTALNKFANFQTRFGGFPFIPVGNPSIMRITQPSGGGKK